MMIIIVMIIIIIIKIIIIIINILLNDETKTNDDRREVDIEWRGGQEGGGTSHQVEEHKRLKTRGVHYICN